MRCELACVPCFVRQAMEAVSEVIHDEIRRESLLRRLVGAIASTDWAGSPPAVGQKIHRMIRHELQCADPYRAVKDAMNQAAACILPTLREAVAASHDPRAAAVRVAIGGNLLDAGAMTQIGPKDLSGYMETVWNRPLHGDTRALFRAVQQARSILYLTDNAGEIVLDTLLLEALPKECLTIAVRGAPIINDATMEDAHRAGLYRIAPVISNGSDAPGTILKDCSDEFRARFREADVVIAKGQGNYETLSEIDKTIFFLFVVKCPLVAERVHSPVGSLVVTSPPGKDAPRS
ncbi:DUF89 family protein [Candidatus Fermentibacteria bacterium]|nr:DUF89 family protein [Candidatus Fermentibacteria bacterium]